MRLGQAFFRSFLLQQLCVIWETRDNDKLSGTPMKGILPGPGSPALEPQVKVLSCLLHSGQTVPCQVISGEPESSLGPRSSQLHHCLLMLGNHRAGVLGSLQILHWSSLLSSPLLGPRLHLPGPRVLICPYSLPSLNILKLTSCVSRDTHQTSYHGLPTKNAPLSFHILGSTQITIPPTLPGEYYLG